MHDAAGGVAALVVQSENGEQIFETFLEKKKNEVDEREKDQAPQPGRVVQLISPTSRLVRCRRC